jgi:hypothetical protein
MVRATVLPILCIALAAATLGPADKTSQTIQTKSGTDDFVAAFPSGGLLRMHIRSADVKIEGGEEDKILVRYEGKNLDRAGDVKVRFKTSGQTGDLSIEGGPHNDFHIIVRVPRKSNLFVRMPFGALEILRITGDKDVEVHAGDVTVSIGSADAYAFVEASVTTGELSADPYNVDKGGLFRSFSAKGHGNYRLHAHVGAGSLTLRN